MADRLIVVDSTISDVHRIVPLLRSTDQQEVVDMGFDVRAQLRVNFRGAFLRKTFWVNGEIAAMSGLFCHGLSNIGFPYLMTCDAIAKTPLAFVKEGHKQIRDMLWCCSHLEGQVVASYENACRLLQVLGFHLDEPQPLGPRQVFFRKFSLSRG